MNTSLYYTGNRWPFPSHEYEEMDGKTALPTRAANVAANKGILLHVVLVMMGVGLGLRQTLLMYWR